MLGCIQFSKDLNVPDITLTLSVNTLKSLFKGQRARKSKMLHVHGTCSWVHEWADVMTQRKELEAGLGSDVAS